MKGIKETVSSFLEVKQNDLIDKQQKKFSSIRQTWNVLHTFAAYLPDKLNNKEEKAFNDFFHSVIYFTSKSDENWKEIVERELNTTKFDFTGRDSASISLCHFHNKINFRLNKEQFPCTLKEIDEVWGHL